MTLGRCLEALRDQAAAAAHAHGGAAEPAGAAAAATVGVPFRESKITRVLQRSLLGARHVLMLANASHSSADFEETSCALRFAATARRVQLGRAVSRIPAPRRVAWRADVVAAEREQQGTANGGGAAARSSNKRRRAAVAARPRQPTAAQAAATQAELVALRQQLSDSEQRCTALDGEMREEMTLELEQQLASAEEAFDRRLAAEQAIYEDKFERKLRVLAAFNAQGGAGNAEECAARMARIVEMELGVEGAKAQIDAERAAWQQSRDTQLQEARVQLEMNVAMEVETLEFQLAQSNKEVERLKVMLMDMHARLKVSSPSGGEEACAWAAGAESPAGPESSESSPPRGGDTACASEHHNGETASASSCSTVPAEVAAVAAAVLDPAHVVAHDAASVGSHAADAQARGSLAETTASTAPPPGQGLTAHAAGCTLADGSLVPSGYPALCQQLKTVAAESPQVQEQPAAGSAEEGKVRGARTPTHAQIGDCPVSRQCRRTTGLCGARRCMSQRKPSFSCRVVAYYGRRTWRKPAKLPRRRRSAA